MFSVVFSGYLSKDATFATYGESSVLNFTVAVHFPTGKKDNEGNEIKETVFLNCSRWTRNGQQEKMLQYLRKGQRVIVTGNQMNVRENTTPEKTFYNIHIMVQNIELIGTVARQEQELEHNSEEQQAQERNPYIPSLDDDLPY